MEIHAVERRRPSGDFMGDANVAVRYGMYDCVLLCAPVFLGIPLKALGSAVDTPAMNIS